MTGSLFLFVSFSISGPQVICDLHYYDFLQKNEEHGKHYRGIRGPPYAFRALRCMITFITTHHTNGKAITDRFYQGCADIQESDLGKCVFKKCCEARFLVSMYI